MVEIKETRKDGKQHKSQNNIEQAKKSRRERRDKQLGKSCKGPIPVVEFEIGITLRKLKLPPSLPIQLVCVIIYVRPLMFAPTSVLTKLAVLSAFRVLGCQRSIK